MAKWQAPREIPLIISRLDGHSIWVGSDPVEAPAFFEDELLALGGIRIDDDSEIAAPRRRGRKPRAIISESDGTSEQDRAADEDLRDEVPS